MIGDADPQVREYLAQSDHVPTDLRARLPADLDPKIRATLAQWWTQALESVRRLLLTDPEETVCAGACATYFRRLPHPAPPSDLLPALLADPVTRAGAVRHCTLDAATAERQAHDPDDEARTGLAEHSALPPPLRDIRSRHRRTHRPQLPPGQNDALASGRRPSPPRGHLAAPGHRSRAEDAPVAPRDFGLPTELVRHLATDPDHTVRRAIATHPKLPTHDLTRLLADPSESVATAAAGNPNLPPAHIHRLLALASL
ncbi:MULTISPECIES: hypothetical protein [unclassified Streptomyces]|uniref:hypothetical protein n=1 Tax=unclassified Streptomyces TaxID=2593676 RepID=UPI0035DE6013